MWQRNKFSRQWAVVFSICIHVFFQIHFLSLSYLFLAIITHYNITWARFKATLIKMIWKNKYLFRTIFLNIRKTNIILLENEKLMNIYEIIQIALLFLIARYLKGHSRIYTLKIHKKRLVDNPNFSFGNPLFLLLKIGNPPLPVFLSEN